MSSGVVLSVLSVAVDELALALVVVVMVDKATRLLEVIFEVKDEREVIVSQLACNWRIDIEGERKRQRVSPPTCR